MLSAEQPANTVQPAVFPAVTSGVSHSAALGHLRVVVQGDQPNGIAGAALAHRTAEASRAPAATDWSLAHAIRGRTRV